MNRRQDGNLYALARTTVLAVAVIAAAWALSGVILLVFSAVLLAATLSGAAGRLAGLTGRSYRLMLAVVVVVMLAIGGVIVFWIVPELLRESKDLVGDLSAELVRLHQHYPRVPSVRSLVANLNTAELSRWHVASSALMIAGVSLDTALSLFVVVVTALYLAISPSVYVGGITRLARPDARPRLREVLAKAGRVLRWWVLGQSVDMLVVGALSAVGLTVAGEPAPLALATLAGLLTFIPYFGAIAASIPAILVALTVGWVTAVWVVGVFLVCHLVEGYIVSPMVQRRVVHLPPAVSLLSMTVMGALFGSLGIVIATPLAATSLLMVRELYVADVLGDREQAE